MSETAEREQVLATAIREISHIATLPEITLQIIELVEDPKSSAQQLHKVISQDPALSSRILKVVNSSFYGLPGQIGSIDRAVVLLGLNAVKNIAIAASLAKLYRGGELTPNFSAKHVWQHSNAVAIASKMIADQLKLGLADEAFLAGLMHDIGLMVELQYDRSKLIEVIEGVGLDGGGVPAQDLRDVEREHFGADHQAFGMALCEKWKFPNSFVQVTGHHHNPMKLATDARTLPCVIYVADRLAAGLEHGYRVDLPDLSVASEVREHLKITNEVMEKLIERLPTEIEEAGDLLA